MDEYFNEKNDCCRILEMIGRRYGRLGGQVKDKYGTIRWYVSFSHSLDLHALVYPGYHYNQFPRWLIILDRKIIGPVLQTLFGRALVWWQVKVYNHAYQVCLKKYPYLRDAILSCADYPEFIKGASK